MTSSFYESLGKASGAPPDISKTNYLETEVDMTESVNENIDEIQKGWDAHYNHLMKIWNHLYERDEKRPQELLNLAEQAIGKGGKKGDLIQIAEYKKELDDYYAYARPLRDKIKEIESKYPPGSPQYIAAMRLLGQGDSEVDSEIQHEELANLVKQESYAAAAQGSKDGDVDEANKITSMYTDERKIYEDISNLKNAVNGWHDAADSGFLIHNVRFDQDGNSIPITYDMATLEEKREIRFLQNAWFAIAHKDSVKGRFGLYKREFINHLILQEETDHLAAVKNFQAAQAQSVEEGLQQDLGLKLETNGPAAIMNDIQMSMKNPTLFTKEGNPNALESRNITEGRLLKVIKDGNHKAIKGIKEWMITPFESYSGEMVTPEKYWAPMVRRLNEAINQRNIADAEEEKNQRKSDEINFIKDAKTEVENSDKVLTWKQAQEFEIQFRQKFGYATNSPLPSHAGWLYTITYKGQEEDHIIEQNARWLWSNGVGITETDLVGIQDQELKQALLKELKGTNAGLTQNSSGVGSVDFRNSAITAIVNDYRNVTTTQTTRDDIWVSNYEQAILFYNEKYAENFAITGSAIAAHRFAVQETKAEIYKTDELKIDLGNGKTQTRTVGRWDLRPHWSGGVDITERWKTIKAVNNDRSLLDQASPYKGEETHLEQAANFFEKMEKGTAVPYPEYYKFLGSRLKINPLLLMRQRLIATGLMDKDTFQIVEEGKPGERLLSTDNSSGRTIRAYLEQGDDVSWMLKTSQNPNTVKEGGYTAIRDDQGKYKNIEEVTGLNLEEITLRDVLGLVEQGYNNIGMYDLQASGFLDLLQASGLSLDVPWNQANQDVLYLARLKQKAQQAQKNTGVNVYYRRVVNLDQELLKRFTEAVGELPPMLNPTNLQADVAKEYIKMLTEE